MVGSVAVDQPCGNAVVVGLVVMDLVVGLVVDLVVGLVAVVLVSTLDDTNCCLTVVRCNATLRCDDTIGGCLLFRCCCCCCCCCTRCICCLRCCCGVFLRFTDAVEDDEGVLVSSS